MDQDCPITYSPGPVVAREIASARFREFDKLEITAFLLEIGSTKITKELMSIFPQFTIRILSERKADIEKEVIEQHLCPRFTELFLYPDLRLDLIVGMTAAQFSETLHNLFSCWDQGYSEEAIHEPPTQKNRIRLCRKLVFPWLYEEAIEPSMIMKVKSLLNSFATDYCQLENENQRKTALDALALKIGEISRPYFERRTKSIFQGTYQAPAGEPFLGELWRLVLEYSHISFLMRETQKIDHDQYIPENILQKELRKTGCSPMTFLSLPERIRLDTLAKAEKNYEANQLHHFQEEYDELNRHALIPWKRSEKELRKLFDLLNTSGALRSTGYYTFKQHFLIYTIDNPEFGPAKRKILWTDKFPYYCLVQMVEALEANGYIRMSIFPGRGRVKYFTLIKYHFLNPFGKNFSDEALRQSVNKKNEDDDEEFLKKVLNAIRKRLLDQNS